MEMGRAPTVGIANLLEPMRIAQVLQTADRRRVADLILALDQVAAGVISIVQLLAIRQADANDATGAVARERDRHAAGMHDAGGAEAAQAHNHQRSEDDAAQAALQVRAPARSKSASEKRRKPALRAGFVGFLRDGGGFSVHRGRITSKICSVGGWERLGMLGIGQPQFLRTT